MDTSSHLNLYFANFKDISKSKVKPLEIKLSLFNTSLLISLWLVATSVNDPPYKILINLENFVSSFSKSNACIGKNNRILVFVESLKIEKNDLKKKLSFFSNLNKNLILINNLKKIPKTYNNKINYFKLKSLKV